MKLFFAGTFLIATLWVVFVDVKLRHQTVLKEQAKALVRLENLDDQYRQIQIESHEALADPQLQMALEDLGYQRNFKTTRNMARRYLKSKEKSQRVEKDSGSQW